MRSKGRGRVRHATSAHAGIQRRPHRRVPVPSWLIRLQAEVATVCARERVIGARNHSLMCDRSARNKNLSDRLFLPGDRYYCKSSAPSFLGSCPTLDAWNRTELTGTWRRECDRLAAIGSSTDIRDRYLRMAEHYSAGRSREAEHEICRKYQARRHLGANAKQI